MAGRSVILRGAFMMAMLASMVPAAAAQSADSRFSFEPSLVMAAEHSAVDPAPAAASINFPKPASAWDKPALHTSLAASFAALQALDVATTLRGIHLGQASEANPFMGGLVQHPAALVGVKAGLTAATILSMRSLSKSHPKAAVLTMLAMNAGSAYVVRSNVRLVMSR